MLWHWHSALARFVPWAPLGWRQFASARSHSSQGPRNPALGIFDPIQHAVLRKALVSEPGRRERAWRAAAGAFLYRRHRTFPFWQAAFVIAACDQPCRDFPGALIFRSPDAWLERLRLETFRGFRHALP